MGGNGLTEGGEVVFPIDSDAGRCEGYELRDEAGRAAHEEDDGDVVRFDGIDECFEIRHSKGVKIIRREKACP